MLIKHYGLRWRPERVTWGSKGKGGRGTLRGTCKLKKSTYERDFWEEVGVYALYKSDTLVYVGRTTKGTLGSTLRSHLRRRNEGRWDTFSWFGLRAINTASNSLRKASDKHVAADEVIKAIEAMLIEVANPQLNRKRESIRKAVKVKQIGS